MPTKQEIIKSELAELAKLFQSVPLFVREYPDRSSEEKHQTLATLLNAIQQLDLKNEEEIQKCKVMLSNLRGGLFDCLLFRIHKLKPTVTADIEKKEDLIKKINYLADDYRDTINVFARDLQKNNPNDIFEKYQRNMEINVERFVKRAEDIFTLEYKLLRQSILENETITSIKKINSSSRIL